MYKKALLLAKLSSMKHFRSQSVSGHWTKCDLCRFEQRQKNQLTNDYIRHKTLTILKHYMTFPLSYQDTFSIINTYCTGMKAIKENKTQINRRFLFTLTCNTWREKNKALRKTAKRSAAETVAENVYGRKCSFALGNSEHLFVFEILTYPLLKWRPSIKECKCYLISLQH